MPVKPPPNAVHPMSRQAWRSWLMAHHTRSEGIWLISYKKASGKPRFAYDEAVEEALCFGWIDSKVNKLDEERAMLWFAPRKPKTGWSKPNKERVERAIASRQMAPPGMAKVTQAKLDGSWTALDAVEALEIPPDLALALAQHAPAQENFETFPRSVKRGILEWISTAKTAPTRNKRVLETATQAAKNVRANQWPK
jgi:uncharacterized protein YdeI (YjbR/CyaY-like superfamily)